MSASIHPNDFTDDLLPVGLQRKREDSEGEVGGAPATPGTEKKKKKKDKKKKQKEEPKEEEVSPKEEEEVSPKEEVSRAFMISTFQINPCSLVATLCK